MKWIAIVLSLVVALLAVSCATKPSPQEEKAPVQTPAPAKTAPAKKVPLPEQEYSQAKSLKAKVDAYGLQEFAPAEYRQAEQKLAEAEAALNKDNAAARKALEEAIRLYNAVLQKGLPLLAQRKQQQVEGLKAQADAIKAPKAMPDAYAKADAPYRAGVAAVKAGEYEKAIADFDQALPLFQSVYDQTRVKKERAEEEIRSAQQGLQDAEKRAQTGEAEIQAAQ
jgi:tetratricopeptide (TPR) repeat protein